MAITFEEKSYVGRNILVLLAIAAATAGIGYWGWIFLQQVLVVAPPMAVSPAGIDMKILEDPAVAAFDLYPEIGAAENEFTSQNPFVKMSAAENAADAEKAAAAKKAAETE